MKQAALTIITLAVLCLAFAHASPAEVVPPGDYGTTRAASLRTGRPLLVYITADWCGPCKALWQQHHTTMAARGHVCRVNVDADPATVNAVAPGSVVPRLAIYSRDKRGQWSLIILEGASRILDWLSQTSASR